MVTSAKRVSLSGLKKAELQHVARANGVVGYLPMTVIQLKAAILAKWAEPTEKPVKSGARREKTRVS